VAWDEHPDYRAEQASRSALYMPATGLDHPGRVFLAAALRARYGGNDEGSFDKMARIVDEENLRAARVTGLGMRLAFTLSGGVPGLLRRAELRLSRDELLLRLPASGPLQGAEAVERRLGALARALGVEARLRERVRR